MNGIPTHVNLMNKTIKVEFTHMPDHCGFSAYLEDKIMIDPNISESLQREVFYHELTHWILFMMGNDLEADEHFVGQFGSLLQQAIETKEGS